MNYSMIAAPLIGAVIGYATNYIAIKMMFRPRKAVKIGNFTLPFTPGIIPKGQPRLARAIGNVIGTSLLSKEILEETLLSDEMKNKVKDSFHQALTTMETDSRTVNDMLTGFVEQETLDTYKTNAVNYIAGRIDLQLQEHPVGDFIANKVMNAAKESVKGGFLALMVNDSVLAPIGARIQQEIDDYLEENALSLVVPPLTEECDHILDQSMSQLSSTLTSHEEALSEAILKGYESLVTNRLENIFNSLDISSIVENRINSMDIIELESLILSVMKKELNAIVNLGALIGFILGLLNLLFK